MPYCTMGGGDLSQACVHTRTASGERPLRRLPVVQVRRQGVGRYMMRTAEEIARCMYMHILGGHSLGGKAMESGCPSPSGACARSI